MSAGLSKTADGSRHRGWFAASTRGLFLVLIIPLLLSPPTASAARTSLTKSSYREEGGVVVLNEANFFPAVHHDFKQILVFFHSPTCGICRGFMRDFRKAAELLRENGANKDMQLGAVNVDKERTLMRALQFPGVPIVKFYIDGRPMRYSGGRGAQNIVDWMRKQALSGVDQSAKQEVSAVKPRKPAAEEDYEDQDFHLRR